MSDLHLTTLHLNRDHPAARLELQDVCRMHARITDMTAGMPPSARVLWAQPSPDGIVVRATAPITTDRLPDGYTRSVTHRLWQPPSYGRYRAVLAVNPTRQRSETDPTTGRRRNIRTPITGDDAQQQWLTSLLSPMIQRLRIRIAHSHTRAGWHREKHRVRLHITYVALTGEVTDPEQLGQLVTAGIGRGRAYGGGLSIWSKQ